jgi:hypothetical protein
MRTTLPPNVRYQPEGSRYALRRDPVSWHLTFDGRTAFFKHKLGALYVAYLDILRFRASAFDDWREGRTYGKWHVPITC